MAWARGPDPCKAFCRCANKTKQNQCLAACRACNGDTRRLGGSCGSYACCTTASCSGVCSDLRSDPNCGACGIDCRDIGEACCETYCADLENDFDNCGSCGFQCPTPGPYEFGECIAGGCHYACVDGAAKCNGVCSSLDFDSDNCGACGHVCPGSAPVCNQGVCICPSVIALCDGDCLDILRGPRQLRCLRSRLSLIGTVLPRGGLLAVRPRSHLVLLRLRRPQFRRQQLRRVRPPVRVGRNVFLGVMPGDLRWLLSETVVRISPH
jgi:hypothetical protein